jgi:hypothetical protein
VGTFKRDYMKSKALVLLAALLFIGCKKENMDNYKLTNYVSVERLMWNVIPGSKKLSETNLMTAQLRNGALIVLQFGDSPQIGTYKVKAVTQSLVINPDEVTVSLLFQDLKVYHSTGKSGSLFKVTDKGIDFANVELTDGQQLFISNGNF